MMFKGDEDNFICDYCGEEFPSDYHSGSEDEDICCGCAQHAYLEWKKSPCKLCGKPMEQEEEEAYWNCDGDSAHKSCINKLTEEQIEEEEWTNDY